MRSALEAPLVADPLSGGGWAGGGPMRPRPRPRLAARRTCAVSQLPNVRTKIFSDRAQVLPIFSVHLLNPPKALRMLLVVRPIVGRGFP